MTMKLLREFEGETDLDRLHDMLRRAGISDVEIGAGVDLSHKGREKVARSLGADVASIDHMLRQLTTQLRDDDRDDTEAWLAEADDKPQGRYSYEADALRNVTVRDNKTGKSVFLQGSRASQLLRRVEVAADPQIVLASVASLMEAAPSGFDREIERDGGNYNFPWKIDGQIGTGTVSFAAGPKLKLDLLSVRDSDGEELEPTALMTKKLLVIARNYIRDV